MKNTNKKLIEVIQIVLPILLLVFTAIFLLEFLLLDLPTVFGVGVNLVSAVDLVLSFGRISAASWYRPLAGTAMGVYYYSTAVFLIVRAILAIKAFINCLNNKNDEAKYGSAIRRLLASFGGSISGILTFHAVSCMVTGYGQMSETLTLLLVLGLVVHFVARVGVYLIEQKDILCAVWEGLLCNGIFMAACLLFCYSLRDASIYSMVQGIMSLFSPNVLEGFTSRYYITLIYEAFLKNIFLMSLLFSALRHLGNALGAVDYRSVGKSAMRGVLISSSVLVGICIIMSAYLANGSIGDTALKIIKEYCPMILAVVAAFLSISFPNRKPAQEAPSNPDADGAAADAPSEGVGQEVAG